LRRTRRAPPFRAEVVAPAADESAPAEVVPYGITMVQADGFKVDPTNAVKVCVIDSGYDLGHEDKPGADVVTGTDDLDGSGPWSEDGSSHGTHVSGTINALDNEIGVIGVFPSVPMHIVRVFGDDGAWAYSSDLIDAVDDCIAHGAKVINMSLGGPLPSVLENQVFLHALKSGVLSIAAAGNGGEGRTCDIWEDASRPERQSCRMHYAAAYDSVVSVAAVDSEKRIADFSQIERGVHTFAVKATSCKDAGGVAAVVFQREGETGPVLGTLGDTFPGIPVVGAERSTGLALREGYIGTPVTLSFEVSDYNYDYFNGTSMATPHVSGVAALLWTRHPECGPTDIRNAMNATAVDLGKKGRDSLFGYGLVQAQAADDYLKSHACLGQ
jgi:serine protease